MFAALTIVWLAPAMRYMVLEISQAVGFGNIASYGRKYRCLAHPHARRRAKFRVATRPPDGKGGNHQQRK